MIYRIFSYSFCPWIVSARLCTVTFGLMYCDLWISKFKKNSFHGNYIRKYGIKKVLSLQFFFLNMKVNGYSWSKINKSLYLVNIIINVHQILGSILESLKLSNAPQCSGKPPKVPVPFWQISVSWGPISVLEVIDKTSLYLPHVLLPNFLHKNN